jgi:hypothetical protein
MEIESSEPVSDNELADEAATVLQDSMRHAEYPMRVKIETVVRVWEEEIEQ